MELPTEQQRVSKEMYKWVEQSCPICETASAKFIGRRGGAAHRANLGVECEIWRCLRCGLVYPNPMPIPVNGVAQHYSLVPDEYFRNHDTEGKRLGALELLKRAEELTGGKGRLLDIGAGRGEFLVAAVSQGWTAIGIEPSDSFAEHAARHSGAEIRRVPVEECGFDEASFDVVILGAVLEHLYNPDETIKEISRILRPGGALFVDVPNEAGLYFKVGNLYQKLRGRKWAVNLAPTFEPFHVFGFSANSLRALLGKHGLKVKNWRVYGGRSVLPEQKGVIGALESLMARAVTAASNIGGLGTYIETWAVKD
jgi:SAM-dependent methyltransferase